MEPSGELHRFVCRVEVFHAIDLVRIDGNEEIFHDYILGSLGDRQGQEGTLQLEVVSGREAIDIVLDGEVPILHLHGS